MRVSVSAPGPARAVSHRLIGLVIAACSVIWTCHSEAPVVPPGPATSLTFSTQPTTTTAGTPVLTVRVTALDADLHVATAFHDTVMLSISSGTGTPDAVLSGTTTVVAVNGVATFTGLSIDKSGPGYTLQASTSSLTATSATFAINAGPLSQLSFTVQPSSAKAGAIIAPAVTVTGVDVLGNLVPNFTGLVTLTITPGTGAVGATLSGGGPVAAVGGTASFANLAIDKVGAVSAGTGYTLSASASGASGATSNPFDIRTGVAKRLQFTTQPTSAAAGAEFAPLVQVSVLDSVGNVVTGFSGNVTLAIGSNPGGATLHGPVTVAVTSGVATFPGVFLDKVGTGYILTAAATGLTTAISAAFNVAPGQAAEVVFTTQPVTSTDSAPLTPAVRVTARDSYGNVVTAFSGNVTVVIAVNPSGGTLSGNTTLAATGGVATFADLRIDKVGSGYRLAASAAGLAPDTSATFDITASTAARLVFTAQPSTATAGSAIAPAIQVSVRDSSNQLVSGFTDSVTIAITGGTGAAGATLSGTTTVAAVGGIATFSTVSLDKSAAGYTLTATASSLQSATSTPFTIISASAKRLAFTVQPSSVAATKAITPPIEVTARDSFGNVATGFTGTIAVSILNNPSGGTLSGASSVAAVAGVAAFSTLSIDKAGLSYTLTATAASLKADTSGAFDVTAAAPSRLVFTVQPATTTAGTPIAVQVTAKDSAGNVVTTFTGAVTVSITSGSGVPGATLSGTPTATAVAGVADFTDLIIDKSGSGYTLSAAAAGISGAVSAAFPIVPGPAARLAFTVQPDSTRAGTAFGVQVTAQDAEGNTASYTGNVSIAIGANPGGGTLSGPTTVAAVAGVAAFSGLSIDKVGAGYTLSASSGALSAATSTPFDIGAGPATALSFSVQPSNTVAGIAINPAIQVAARDAQGNLVASFGGSVTIAFSANPGGGVLSGATTVSAVGGVATFSTLTIDKAAAGYAFSASTAGLSSATSASFSIVPGAAAVLVFTVQPTTTTTGANIAPAVKVTAFDARGNQATGFNGNITVGLGANPGGGTLSGTRTFAAINGVASYQALSINNTGTGYTLTASAAGLPVDTSATFDIILSVATQLFFTVQPPQLPDSAKAGSVLSPSIVVTARDASGQPATTFNGAVTLSIVAGTGAPGAILSGTRTVTAVAGAATFSDLSIDKSGTGYKLLATAPGLPSLQSAFFTVLPGAAVKLAFTLQPSTATVNAPITPNVEVTVRDAQGNTVTGFTGNVTVAISNNPTNGVLSGTTTVAAVNGIASFSGLSINAAGTGYSLAASATGLTGATSAAFNVTLVRATQLAFTTQPSATTAGAAMAPVKLTALDASGAVATGFSGAVTVTITAGTGTAGAILSGATTVTAVAGVATFSGLSVNRSGSGYRLSAISSGVSGVTSAPFTINPGAAARVTFTVQPGSAVSTAFIPGANGPTIEVTVRDAQGNPVKTFNGSVTLSLLSNPASGVLSGTTTASAPNGVAEFNDLSIDKAGTGYALGVTSGSLATDTSNAFSITAGAAVRLQFSVQPSSVAAGAAISPAIRVTAFDAQGNLATGFTGNVSLAIGTNPSGGVLSGITTVTPSNGVAIFSGLSITPAGTGYTLSATAAGLTPAASVAFSIN